MNNIKDLKPFKRSFVVGDVHLGARGNSNQVFEAHKQYFENFLIPLLKDRAKPGDVLLFTGDINDYNSVFRSDIQDQFRIYLYQMSQILPIVIIVGNHDIVKKKTNDVNGINVFNHFKDVYVITSHAEVDTDTEGHDKLLLMPWNDSPEDEADIIENTDAKYVLSHTHTSDMPFTDEFVFKNKNGDLQGNPITIFDKFKRVWNGHVHKYKDFGTVVNVGSIMQFKSSDEGNESVVILYDFVEEQEEKIVNEGSPTYLTITLESLLDMTIKEANNLIANKYVTVLYDGSLFGKVYFTPITDEIEGYLSIDFVPVISDQAKNSKDRVVEIKNTNLEDYMKRWVKEEVTQDRVDPNEVEETLLTLHDEVKSNIVEFD